MKCFKNIVLVLIVLLINAFSASSEEMLKESTELNKIHIPFIENNGQVNKEILYYANTFYGTTCISKNGNIVYNLPVTDKATSIYTFSEELLNANDCKVEGKNRASGIINYFTNRNKSDWNTNISSYSTIIMNNVYNGINLELKAYSNNIEKLFVVSCQGNPNEISLKLNGVRRLKIKETGELAVVTKHGDLKFTKPIAYQIIDGKKEIIEVAYKVKGKQYGFIVGNYNKNYDLIIDPLLSSSFIGGNSNDEIYQPNIAIDSKGNVFVTGNTYSSQATFPMLDNGLDSKHGGQSDKFVCKFSNDLSTLLAATYFGGSSEERGPAICIDANDNIYIGGYTKSANDFPVVDGCYDVTYNGNDDAYVAKLNNDLNELLACTYFGGSGEEGMQWPRLDIQINSMGHVYIAGNTKSTDLPMIEGVSFDTSFNGGSGIDIYDGGDSFLACFDADLTTLLGSTYLGGSSDEWWVSLAIDSKDDVFICGGTLSTDFPSTQGVFDVSFAQYNEFCADVYVTKFNPELSSMLASTSFGDIADEWVSSMKINNKDEIFLSTYVGPYINHYMNSNSYSSSFSGGYTDACVAKFNNDLSKLLACTYFGGSDNETASYLILGNNNDIYVCGKTKSTDIIPAPFNEVAFDTDYNGGTDDGYFFRMDDNLTTLKAITYIGGSKEDRIQGMAINPNGDVFIVGRTESSMFPVTSNAYDDSFNGGLNDVFVSKFDSTLLAEKPDVYFFANEVKTGINSEVVFADTSFINYDTYQWDFGEGAEPQTATGAGPHTVKYTSIGKKSIKLTANSTLFGTATKIKTDYVDVNTTAISYLLETEIEIYPNPTKNYIYVKNNSASSLNICIYNALGEKIVSNINIHDIKAIDLSKFQNGIYIIQIKDNFNNLIQRQIVKI